MLAELRNCEESALFTPAEKAALRLAAVMAGEHRQASDQLFDELRKYYTEAQILELGWRIGIFIGYGRLVYALGVEGIGQSCVLPARQPG